MELYCGYKANAIVVDCRIELLYNTINQNQKHKIRENLMKHDEMLSQLQKKSMQEKSENYLQTKSI